MEQTSIHHGPSLARTAELVAAYVSSHNVRTGELPSLISSVHSALAGLGALAPEIQPIKQAPAVSVKKSITPDALISLEDGKSYKTLKRHLAGRGMTPADYRTKWNLPANYPMVAASYATRRSELAKASGLGRKGAVPVAIKQKQRGRKKAA